MSIFHSILWFVPIGILSMFAVYSIPFIKLFRKNKFTKSYLIPVILFLRAASIFSGLLCGMLNELLKKK